MTKKTDTQSFAALTWYLVFGAISLLYVSLDFVLNQHSSELEWIAYKRFLIAFGSVYLPGLGLILLVCAVLKTLRK